MQLQSPVTILLIVVLNSLTSHASPQNGGVISRNEERRRAVASCPDNCRCGQITGITCYSLSKDTPLPTDLPEDTKSLTLYRYVVNEKDLQRLKQLEKLNIYDGRVTQVPKLSRTLIHLDIINCHLKGMDNVQQLVNLQSMNVAYNNVSEANLFHLTHLTNLDMSHNPLEVVPQVPPSLIVLNLQRTPLRQHSTIWKEHLPNLKRLVLTGTRMNLPPYLSLPNLEVLQLSHSSFKLLPYLSNLPNLREIDLSHTELYNALPAHFKGPTNLKIVNLSYSNLRNLPDKLFTHNLNLQELNLHHTTINYIKDYTLYGLNKLRLLNLNNNPNLTAIGDEAFSSLHSLTDLDISETRVKLLPYSLQDINIKVLNMNGITLFCDCHSNWLPNYLTNATNTTVLGSDPINCSDGTSRSPDELRIHIKDLQCKFPIIESPAKTVMDRSMGKTALLECNSTGYPQPTVIWYTPKKEYYMYNKTESRPWFSEKFQYILDHMTYENTTLSTDLKVTPLKSGHLLIMNITRDDVGLYRCIAVNSMGSITTTTFLWLSQEEMISFEYQSLLFGLACAIIFLLTTLIVQLIRFIMDRMGWECCCCRGRISSKAQQVKKILEGVESYRTQQLDRLRDNYNCQVVSIKEGCYQQMDRLSESYSQQCKNIQSIKDYSAQGLTTLRDQYLDQANKVRDYSTGQMSKVYENYVFQRQRVRKFSAHQMFKLRETYKYQQRTLNKILENIPDLYLQNCRTGGNCNRSDSIIFDDEIHGIDAYYRLDFLNPMIPAYEGSEDCYFTPSSTLTKAQRHYILQHHRRQKSNGSNSISNNDFQEANESWATNTPCSVSPHSSPSHYLSEDVNKKHPSLKHTRSLSSSASPNNKHRQTHRRTHSATTHPTGIPETVPAKALLNPNLNEETETCHPDERMAMLDKNNSTNSNKDSSLESLPKTHLTPRTNLARISKRDDNLKNTSFPPIIVDKKNSPNIGRKCEDDINKDENSSSLLLTDVTTDDTGNRCRQSLSREGSKEIEGRLVLPSLTEVTEPTVNNGEETTL